MQLATSRSVPSIIHTQVPQMCMQNDENSSKIQLQNYTNIETHKYEKNEKKINHQICSIHYSCLSAADTEQEQQILDFPKPSKYELSSRLLHNSIKHLKNEIYAFDHPCFHSL